MAGGERDRGLVAAAAVDSPDGRVRTREQARDRDGRGERHRPRGRGALVANAGFQHVAPVAEFDDDRWDAATAICPGFVRMPLVEGQLAGQAEAHGISEDEALEQVILPPHAIKRLIEPDDVARAVTFLLGPSGWAFSGAPFVMDAR